MDGVRRVQSTISPPHRHFTVYYTVTQTISRSEGPKGLIEQGTTLSRSKPRAYLGIHDRMATRNLTWQSTEPGGIGNVVHLVHDQYSPKSTTYHQTRYDDHTLPFLPRGACCYFPARLVICYGGQVSDVSTPPLCCSPLENISAPTLQTSSYSWGKQRIMPPR